MTAQEPPFFSLNPRPGISPGGTWPKRVNQNASLGVLKLELERGAPYGEIIIPVFLGESVPPEMLAATLAELDVPSALAAESLKADPQWQHGAQCVETAVGEDLFQETLAAVLKAKTCLQ
ncbi:hypothetical protein H8959_006731 [Pygathrix nigripes]